VGACLLWGQLLGDRQVPERFPDLTAHRVGQDEIAMRRISDALGHPGTSARIRHDQPPPPGDDRTQPDTAD
jgi:hypothetical protein